MGDPYPQNVAVMMVLAPELDETSRMIAMNSGGLIPYVASNKDGVLSAKSMQSKSTNPSSLNKVLRDGLKFPYFDYTYGVQDTLQANYDTISPMGAPEGFNIYNNTQNRIIEFMIKLFAESEDDVKDVHDTFCALQSLVLPWTNSVFTRQFPPPKIKLIASSNIYATGFLNNITVTHYDPVTEIKIGDGHLKVMEFIEIVCSFTRQALAGHLLPYGNAVGYVDGYFIGFGGLADAQIP